MSTDTLREIFGEPISVYTRAQALEDGVLVDVSAVAREAGFTVPVALTAAVYADVARSGDEKGRLWDVLWMARLNVRRAKGNTFTFGVLMQVGRTRKQTYKAVCGPNDDASPCITIMKLEED